MCQLVRSADGAAGRDEKPSTFAAILRRELRARITGDRTQLLIAAESHAVVGTVLHGSAVTPPAAVGRHRGRTETYAKSTTRRERNPARGATFCVRGRLDVQSVSPIADAADSGSVTTHWDGARRRPPRSDQHSHGRRPVAAASADAYNASRPAILFRGASQFSIGLVVHATQRPSSSNARSTTPSTSVPSARSASPASHAGTRLAPRRDRRAAAGRDRTRERRLAAATAASIADRPSTVRFDRGDALEHLPRRAEWRLRQHRVHQRAERGTAGSETIVTGDGHVQRRHLGERRAPIARRWR